MIIQYHTDIRVTPADDRDVSYGLIRIKAAGQ